MSTRDNGVTVPLTSNSIYPTDTLMTDAMGNMANVPGEFGAKIMNTSEYTDTIPTLEGKYNMNIHDIAVKRSRKKFPIKFIADLNTKSIQGPTHVYGEDWDGDMSFPDTFLDDIRKRNLTVMSISDTANKGGQLRFKTPTGTDMTKMSAIAASITAGTAVTPATGSASIITATTGNVLSEQALVTYNGFSCLPIAFKLDTGEAIQGGDASRHVMKMLQILKSMNYTIQGGTGNVAPLTQAGAKDWYVAHRGPKALDVHEMFPDLGISIDGILYQEHEAVVMIESLWFSQDLDEYIVFINMDRTNLKNNISATAANTKVLLSEMVTDANTSTSFGTDAIGMYTRFDRQWLVGMYNTVADAVEEGSGARLDGHSIWQYGTETKTNYVQTFRSKPVEITGTRLATSNFREDDIKRHRSTMMDQYNTTKSNTGLWGVKSKAMGANGRPIRTMAGLFDYTQNDIRYIRALLPTNVSNTSEAIYDWINNLAYCFSAFKEKEGSEVLTFATSHEILRRLSKLVVLSRTQDPNLYGTQAAMGGDPRATSVDFSVAKFDFISSYGITIRFIHAPEFDKMTDFPLPSFITGSTRIRPMNIIVALDKQYISNCVLRPDKLQGNIQSADEDLTREDIIGEMTQEVMYTKNHAVIIVDFV